MTAVAWALGVAGLTVFCVDMFADLFGHLNAGYVERLTRQSTHGFSDDRDAADVLRDARLTSHLDETGEVLA